MTYALVASLLVHASLLMLTFGGQAPWLTFGFPWQNRRIEAPDLRVVVVSPQITAAEPAVTLVEQPSPQIDPSRTAGSPQTLSTSPAASSPSTARAVAAKKHAKVPADSAAPAATNPIAAQPSASAGLPDDTAPAPIGAPSLIAVERTDEDTWAVPQISAMPAPMTAAVPRIAVPITAAVPRITIPESASSSSRDQENAARTDVAQNAPKSAGELTEPQPSREQSQPEPVQPEAARQDAERQENSRAKENERKAIERKEIERKEIERKEIERREIERKDTERKDTERKEAERKEAERKEAAERREAALRAIGRQLDEEAARREAASRALPSASSARRYRLWGQTDPNAELVLYALVWARKIEMSTTFDTVRDAAKQPHRDPVVTVAVRSDGSVESVTFEMSSGVPALDQAIRRVVESQLPYRPFPASLANLYDVVEIRRTWYFDVAIRLY